GLKKGVSLNRTSRSWIKRSKIWGSVHACDPFGGCGIGDWVNADLLSTEPSTNRARTEHEPSTNRARTEHHP
ncbi:hypothetical protein GBL98_15540, partial [Yersinia pseudotuberculosis]|nr:hypothetical protein [Yersinia pseudotuberculosis]MBO1612184.1 hypothetical protein [Yersinia pseudotuberculosis]MBO1622525.1 hypothetical protein [Yersinia pseudotuberculosis]